MYENENKNFSSNEEMILSHGAQKQKQDLSPITKEIIHNYIYFIILSLVFGIFFTFCYYKNHDGIALLGLVIGGYAFYILAFRRLNIKIKRSSYPYMVGSILLGLSIVLTGNGFINFFNKVGILLLSFIFLIKQLYDDKLWSFGLYILNGLNFIFYTIGSLLDPISHFEKYKVETNHVAKNRKIKYVIYGVLISIPLVFVLMILLLRADNIFLYMISSVFKGFFGYNNLITNIVSMTLLFLFGVVAFYGSLSALSAIKLKTEEVGKRSFEPLTAITFTTIISILYSIFCVIQVIQIINAVSGNRILSYSDFARRGFFELLFVSIINFVMVLICSTKFENNKLLNGLLTFISCCTFIMIISSGYKMILYIQKYHLTFDRILVLLGLLFLLIAMSGVIISIYNKKFPLLKYILWVGMSIYIVFSFSKPDKIIADYNIAHMDLKKTEDINYLFGLSVDAIPSVMNLYVDGDLSKEYVYEMVMYKPTYINSNDFRTYNVSRARADKIINEYLK